MNWKTEKIEILDLHRQWVTSDAHLGHGNILLYCRRPWLREGDWYETEGNREAWVSKDIKEARTNEMNEAMVRSWNEVVNPGDTVRHLGDFCFRSGKQRHNVEHWENRLNGRIIHIKGNHDRAKDFKEFVRSEILEVAGHRLFLQHHPPGRPEDVPQGCDIVLCGHVHEHWDHKWVGNKLVVNVGVDVRGFKPWKLRDAIKEAERLLSCK